LTRGARRMPFTRLKMAALAPMPRARGSTTVTVKPLVRRRDRKAILASFRNVIRWRPPTVDERGRSKSTVAAADLSKSRRPVGGPAQPLRDRRREGSGRTQFAAGVPLTLRRDRILEDVSPLRSGLALIAVLLLCVPAPMRA